MSKQKDTPTIKTSEFVISSKDVAKCPEPSMPEIAFVGRSNVGKSSLLNMLTSRKSLAKVSATPGKTRLINHFLINNSWYLVDLPGYGWAKVSKKEVATWEDMVHDYFLRRENLNMVFVLIDSRLNPQKSDLEMINWLGNNNIPLGLVFTKADKISKNKVSQSVATYRKTLLEFWSEMPPHFITSSKNNVGKDELIEYITEKCLS